MKKTLYAIIARTKGLIGELKLKVVGDYDLLSVGLKLYTNENTILTIESFYITNKGAYIKFKEINSIEDANLLKDTRLFVDRDKLPELITGEYYINDIVGCDVYNDYKQYIGIITEINNYGSTDIVTIANKGKIIEVPLIEGLFGSVELKEKIIIISDKIFKRIYSK